MNTDIRFKWIYFQGSTYWNIMDRNLLLFALRVLKCCILLHRRYAESRLYAKLEFMLLCIGIIFLVWKDWKNIEWEIKFLTKYMLYTLVCGIFFIVSVFSQCPLFTKILIVEINEKRIVKCTMLRRHCMFYILYYNTCIIIAENFMC